eukprot:GEMP01062612.1.p1 GENE.GEMP01062612.1~~GEMP01062612.1.p1  ORF type:complete len:303 (+),score=60.62 GEMP01062612.1:96-1004(+)
MTDPNAAASAEAYMQYFQNMGAYGNMMPMMTTDQMGIIPNLMQQPPTQGLSVGGRGHRDISSLGNEHCKYWRFGRCARGETCFYKHDPAFLGVDRPGSNGVPLASPIPTPGMSMAHMGSYPGYQQQYVAANQQYMGAGQFIDFNSTSIGGRQYGQSAAAAAGAAAAAAAAAAQAAAPLVYVAGGRRFNGFVRSYSTLNGFGFIGGDEINEVIGQDVFLHQREIAEVTGDAKPSLASGTTLSFTVIRNQKGQPQARDLVFDDPGQAGTQAKIDADIAKFQNYVATAGKNWLDRARTVFVACVL